MCQVWDAVVTLSEGQGHGTGKDQTDKSSVGVASRWMKAKVNVIKARCILVSEAGMQSPCQIMIATISRPGFWDILTTNRHTTQSHITLKTKTTDQRNKNSLNQTKVK